MCTRYDYHHGIDTFKAALAALRGSPVDVSADLNLQANYNAAPTDSVPVIIVENNQWVVQTMEFGLIPSFVTDTKDSPRPVNARADGILIRPYFREAVRLRRCLLPMSGYYEWQKVGKERLPYYIHRKDRQLFFAAGIWEEWVSPSGPIRTVASITVEANEMIQTVPHDRMIAILEGDSAREWMNPKTTATQAVTLLRPYSGDALTMHRVNKRVHRAGQNGPECIEPQTEKPHEEKNLFDF